MVRHAGAVLGMLFLAHAGSAQVIQQGNKLVGAGAIGAARQAHAVAISADGTTAIAGGPSDNNNAGAAWVYTRNEGAWSPQGSKLIGTEAVGAAGQGWSVAISAHGNTAIVGGPSDNTNVGAAWVYTRNDGVWSQQGSKLVGSGAVGAARQGISVAISADGATAVVGGHTDNLTAGGVWVFTRNGGVWSQQGSKLVGSGAVGAARQGRSVALSADGNTVIVGGYQDDSDAGAAWVFTRSGGAWSQQGGKLVGAGAVGSAMQGWSVAIAGDGATAIVGGPADNTNLGTAWVYTRNRGVWSPQDGKLAATGAAGTANLGWSVAISGDGNAAVVGGPRDGSGTGAAWVYTRSEGMWAQQGSKLVGTGAVGAAQQATSVALSADGSTALVGGSEDSSNAGAAWVFVAKGGAAAPVAGKP